MTSPPPEVAAVLAEVAYEFLISRGYHNHYPSAEEPAAELAAEQLAALTAAGLVGGGTREVSDE